MGALSDVTATTTAATTLAAEEGGGGFWEDAYPVIPHPGELIVGIISFVVLYVVYRRMVVPRLEKLLAERQKNTEGGTARAEAMQAEAKAARDQSRAQLAEARTAAARPRDRAGGDD